MASLVKTDKISTTAGGAQEFTLPAADGTANQHLKTDGSGVLGWASAPSITGSTNTWIPTITGADALTGTANFTYDGNTLDIKNGGTASSINLYCETSNLHYVKIKSGPHASATSYTLTLPNAPPASNGLALTATTAGVASWASVSGGKVLKVYQATKTDTTSIASTTFADITGLTITTDAPASTGSRFFVLWNVMVGIPAGTATMTRLERTPSGGSDVYPFIGDAAGSRPRTSSAIDGAVGQYTMMPFNGNYLDSPSASVALTYTIQWKNSSGSTAYLNRTFNDRDTANYDARAASSIVVMEIGS